MNLSVGYVELRYAVVGAVTCMVFAVAYAMASAPSRQPSRLGMRGFKRQRALETGTGFAMIEPLVRWLGVRVSGILGGDFRARLERQLAAAGDYMGFTPEEYVGVSILSGLGGIAFGYVAGILSDIGPVLIMIVGPLGAALPYIAVSGERERRLKQVGRGLPYAVDLLALSMSAGQDFPGAVRQVVEKSSDPDDALVEEFGRILQELHVGHTRKQTLLNFAERVQLDAVQEFVSAVVQAEERGNPVAEVLQIQASVSRVRRTVKAEEAASKAGVQMVGPLFLVFFCIMLMVMGPMLLKLAAQE